ncbi:putative short-chain protein [Rosellinia necatrix]|uniref:Putative short-chain protein n=1 Tax=Rosellinia necatrix TaxID=77044 RepID=A0A1S7UKP7_ROSNE|nr:putative short-chain protein [Rosellinia necatrix]
MASIKGSIFITGANGGLGSAIVQHIVNSPSLAKAYRGLYTVRSTERAGAVQKALQKATLAGHKYDLVPLDLSSLASTRKVAEDINKQVADGSIPPIRALILNAAWQEYTTHTMTDDGFDMTFQSNHLSHFLLTLLLLKSMDKKNGRIVILGSWSHDTSDPRNTVPGILRAYEDEKWNLIFKEPVDTEPLARGKWSTPDDEPGSGNTGYRRYGASKLCNVMFMRELSKRIAADPELSSIAALAVDPGAMPTGLARRTTSRLLRAAGAVAGPLMAVVSKLAPGGSYRTTAQSAADLVRAAFDTDALGDRPNGVYLNGAAAADVGPEARDPAKCERLWTDSLRFAQVGEGDTALAAWR